MSEKNMMAELEGQQQQPDQAYEIGIQKDITDTVLSRVNSLEQNGTIKMPGGYNAGNALKAAWLILQKVQDKNKNYALKVCTTNSIANALFGMCIQGLSPAKNQCYFIVRGNELTMMRSYFGTVSVLKRLKGVEDVFAQVIYQGDEFEYVIDGGNIVVTKHEQKLSNIDLDKIVGAYAVIVKDGKPRCEVMTISQIKTAWSHTTNGGGVQREYPDQMAKRTVINRGAKMYVNTSDDADELIEAINRSTDAEYMDEPMENGDPISLPAAPVALPVPQQAMEIPVQVKEEAPVQAATRKGPGF